MGQKWGGRGRWGVSVGWGWEVQCWRSMRRYLWGRTHTYGAGTNTYGVGPTLMGLGPTFVGLDPHLWGRNHTYGSHPTLMGANPQLMGPTPHLWISAPPHLWVSAPSPPPLMGPTTHLWLPTPHLGGPPPTYGSQPHSRHDVGGQWGRGGTGAAPQRFHSGTQKVGHELGGGGGHKLGG